MRMRTSVFMLIIGVVLSSTATAQRSVDGDKVFMVRSAEETARIYGYTSATEVMGTAGTSRAIVQQPVFVERYRPAPVDFSVDATNVAFTPMDQESHRQVMDYHRAGLQTEQVRHRMGLDNRQMGLQEDQTYHWMGLDNRRQTQYEGESVHRQTQDWVQTLGLDAQSRQTRERDKERVREAERRHQADTIRNVRDIFQDARRDRERRENQNH